ncbi:MAG: hypothetical protein KBD21_03680 [Candidatus Pacebacteria bacterium]|nr:hypothetical protein [Candidatus Paceibacterota bacterium]
MTGSYTKFFGHAIVILILGWLTYISLTQEWVPILDGANLIFHEAGHWIFFWGPQFLMVLGGTLGQIVIPAVCAVAFWREQKMLSMRIMLWWLGQNMVNVSVYVGDARAQVLPLLGGDGAGHDWAYLLHEMGLLAHDTAIAIWVASIGTALMVYMLIEITLHAWEFRTHRFHR